MTGQPRYRSKTIATWLAVLGGCLGLHRFYLHGWRDARGWLWPCPTLAGLYGVQRIQALGHDDRLAWLLVPLLGLALTLAMASAIFYGLTPDVAWDARLNPGQAPRRTAWGPIIGVIVALMLGAVVLLGTIAYCGQRFFEWQAQAEPDPSRQPAAASGQSSARPAK